MSTAHQIGPSYSSEQLVSDGPHEPAPTGLGTSLIPKVRQMPNPPRTIRDYLPRNPAMLNKRGQVLVILGVVWVLIGFGVLADPHPVGWENIWMFTAPPVWLR